MSDKPWHPTFPAFYCQIHRLLVGIGRKHGYAMALHGSLATDLDVVAVPWVEDAATPETLVAAIVEHLGVVDLNVTNPGCNPGLAPHGRKAWTFHMDFGGGKGGYIDLSVMPLHVTP